MKLVIDTVSGGLIEAAEDSHRLAVAMIGRRDYDPERALVIDTRRDPP